MVRHGTELIMARRQIEALIKADPATIVIRRRTRVSTPDGGWKWSDTEMSLEPQEVCLIPFKRRMTEFLANTELGDVPDLPYVLLGRHNADIKRNDRFTYNGDEFRVETVDLSEPEVKVSAHIDYFGGQNNGKA